MAKSNWGITSGFIGKLGNVVGFNWKGKNVQRALTKASNPNTKEQTLQRTKFAIVTHACSDLYEAVYEGFRCEANNLRTTENGLFVKYNMEHVEGNDVAELVLDYEHLQLSSGKLRGVEFAHVGLSNGVLGASIGDSNLYGRRVSASDRVYLVAYCPELRDARCQAVGTRIDTHALTMTLPTKWATKRVYAYGFVVGAAAFNDGLSSKTEYLGAYGNGSSGGGSQSVNAPRINGTTPFTDTTQVTISAESGATIHYTTDGTEPTAESTEYSSAITLSATTTVKAIAIKGGISSTVTSKTFTKSSGGGNDSGGGYE